MKASTRRASRMVAVVLCFLAGAIAAPAQSASTDPGPGGDQPVKLEKFEVTGSYIPYASTQTALPLTVFDAETIADTGVATNVLDVLHKMAPQFSGNSNIGNSNAGADVGLTNGGSALAFRNTQTLVLVNGRRMSYAPAGASGGLQFVDVNLIPLAAIERIEVLQDGASATYGTDAVGGVVNIILKTDFQGFEVDARYGVSPNPGRYAERLFSAVGGTSVGGTRITFSVEEAHSGPLFQYQRGFSSPAYGTPSFGGVINTPPANSLPQFYVLNPSLNAPPAGHTDLATLVADGVYLPVNGNNLTRGVGSEQQYAFDLSRFSMLLLKNERRSATLNFEHRVNEGFTVFGDFIFARTGSFTELNAQPITAVLGPANSSNPTTQTMAIRNRFTDYPRLYYYDSTSIRGIAGARGNFADDFRWEAAVDRNVITQNFTNPNLVDSALRAAAIAGGLIDLAAREQAPGAIEAAGLFGTAWGRATSTLSTADARVTGAIWDLPAGPLSFAVGSEYRIETLDQASDPNSHSDTFNWDSGVAIDPFHHDRNVWSTFAELRVPLLGERQDVPGFHALELSAAVRHERYSDTDNPTVPKFSLAWHPWNDEFLLRATLSQSFAAPTLFELFGPTGVDDEDDVEFLSLAGDDTVRQVHLRFGANPDLLPSRSTNRTFGFVWSPHVVKGLSVTTDFFDIRQTDLVSAFADETIVQDVELHGPASPYARFVKVGAFDGAAIAAPGQISADTSGDLYVNGADVNIANLKLRGADVKVEYLRNFAGLGRIGATVSVTSYRTYTIQALPGVAPVETVGLATPENGTIPHWQSYTSVAWSRGRWRANVNWQHIPGVTDPQGNGTEKSPFVTRTYDSFDVAASCVIDLRRHWVNRLTFTAGVNNVFNRMPPYSGGTYGSVNVDLATYSPIGRLLFMEGKYAF